MKSQIASLYSSATALAVCWYALAIFPARLPAQTLQQDEWEKVMLAARAAFNNHQLAEADRLYSSALRQRDSAGIRDVYLARALYELGAVRELTGRYADAIRLITRAIGVLVAVADPDPGELANAWQGLGSAYFGVRAYPKAVEAYSKALELRSAKGDAGSAEMFSILAGLSTLYRAQHKNRDAEAVLTRAQTLFIRAPRSDQSIQALLLTSLGNLYLSERRLAEAAAALRQAQSIAEDLVTSGKVATLPLDLVRPYISHNLALVCLEQKQYREAEALFTAGLSLADHVAMPSEDVALMLHGYARCLRKLGSKDDARRIDSKAKTILAAVPRQGDFVVDASALIRIK